MSGFVHLREEAPQLKRGGNWAEMPSWCWLRGHALSFFVDTVRCALDALTASSLWSPLEILSPGTSSLGLSSAAAEPSVKWLKSGLVSLFGLGLQEQCRNVSPVPVSLTPSK